MRNHKIRNHGKPAEQFYHLIILLIFHDRKNKHTLLRQHVQGLHKRRDPVLIVRSIDEHPGPDLLHTARPAHLPDPCLYGSYSQLSETAGPF